jgi:hypothetical protein
MIIHKNENMCPEGDCPEGIGAVKRICLTVSEKRKIFLALEKMINQDEGSVLDIKVSEEDRELQVV